MLAIAGGKGGSGKTTTTLGLARAFDGRTLVVDADGDMPNLHALAAVDRRPTLAAVDGERRPERVAQGHPEDPDVSVLPAPVGRPDDTADTEGGDADLQRLLRRLRSFDEESGHRTLVDCPAGAGPDAVAPLRVVDRVLVVSPLCAAALRDAAKTAAMARTLGTPVVGAVLTRTRLRPPGVGDLLDCPVVGSVPEVRPPVLERDAVRTAYGRLATTLGEET
ncbi:septum site-determining protein MinD [Halogranum amylolyticum]|uniref:Septum site-determining protein MinD n=1 Tax=Halogranum amylolyticum TaxID=660520 RepID=A0A1H8T720_9EURY|nr:CDP-4-keto-6-deoxy-D-glucose-3-dehydrase [Halogranum amylolyticum]SEO86820.1 septum site-determining protein MinD [Halogranum amylolyticum]